MPFYLNHYLSYNYPTQFLDQLVQSNVTKQNYFLCKYGKVLYAVSSSGVLSSLPSSVTDTERSVPSSSSSKTARRTVSTSVFSFPILPVSFLQGLCSFSSHKQYRKFRHHKRKLLRQQSIFRVYSNYL